MRKTLFVSLLALAMSALFISAAMAVENPVQLPSASMPKLEKFSGTIESVDAAKKDVVVQMKEKKETFSVSDHTKIMEGTKALAFSDLKKGQEASVEYLKEGNQMIAQLITVGAPMGKMGIPSAVPGTAGAGSTEKK